MIQIVHVHTINEASVLCCVLVVAPHVVASGWSLNNFDVSTSDTLYIIE